MYALPVTGASTVIYALVGMTCLISGLVVKLRNRQR